VKRDRRCAATSRLGGLAVDFVSTPWRSASWLPINRRVARNRYGDAIVAGNFMFARCRLQCLRELRWRSGACGQQFESVTVRGTHGAEVAMIKRCDPGCLQALRDGDD
jgi:hypothetical protein